VLFGWREHTASQGLFAEAVNDHLRLLYAERPIEIESGGVHQVKPWFAGRVDFATALGFGGDEEFPLQGGAVALFFDRKAAAFEFKRRLHPITLFVFRAEGLPWPAAGRPLGPVQAAFATQRGFHVMLWRRGDLGYALVSDVDEKELTTLGSKLAAER
jgi:anti-sigma factor RsiW